MPKWLKWEFWPWRLVYIPVWLYAHWLALRIWNRTYFVPVNPAMHLGGFCYYSKYDVLVRIPQKYRPPMCLIESPLSAPDLLSRLKAEGIAYPFILKPDRGERGQAVALIGDRAALEGYLKNAPYPLIAQGYIDLSVEVGVLYSRLPDETLGIVSSIVHKDFLHVIGDGTSTLHELAKRSDRAKFYLEKIEREQKDRLEEVPPVGEKWVLEWIGNHVRGTTFRGANHLITPELTAFFDGLARQIEGYYYGRFDLRVPNLASLETGEGLQIIELNGVNSEPAHIYDPGFSLWKAYRSLFWHWKRIWRIGRANHKNGVPYPPARATWREVYDHLKARKAAYSNS